MLANFVFTIPTVMQSSLRRVVQFLKSHCCDVMEWNVRTQ